MVGSSREIRSSKTFPKDNVSVSIGPVPQTQILRVDRTRMCDPQPKILPFGWSQCSVGCRVATCLHVDHGPMGSRCMRKLFQNSPLDHPAPLQGGVVDRGGGAPRGTQQDRFLHVGAQACHGQNVHQGELLIQSHTNRDEVGVEAKGVTWTTGRHNITRTRR